MRRIAANCGFVSAVLILSTRGLSKTTSGLSVMATRPTQCRVVKRMMKRKKTRMTTVKLFMGIKVVAGRVVGLFAFDKWQYK